MTILADIFGCGFFRKKLGVSFETTGHILYLQLSGKAPLPFPDLPSTVTIVNIQCNPQQLKGVVLSEEFLTQIDSIVVSSSIDEVMVLTPKDIISLEHHFGSCPNIKLLDLDDCGLTDACLNQAAFINLVKISETINLSDNSDITVAGWITLADELAKYNFSPKKTFKLCHNVNAPAVQEAFQRANIDVVFSPEIISNNVMSR